MLPVKLTISLPRTIHFQEKNNNEDLIENLDIIKERLEWSNICQAVYKNVVERNYNHRVKEKAFKVGNYVLRKNEASHSQQGKIDPM